MKYYDVFNGDADGICALHQLRLENPLESILVTGIKRKIDLLSGITPEKGDVITVLDVSLDKNREALLAHLQKGARILYFDHHFAGEIPKHESLETHINTERSVCTSLLVNGYLGGKHQLWAITGAFGDNLDESAHKLTDNTNLTPAEIAQLKKLGMYINYNGYGSKLDDLHFHPDVLYTRIKPYRNPLDFIKEDSAFHTLEEGYEADLAHANELQPEFCNDTHAMYILPEARWARRVSGVLSNLLARKNPTRAHALLSQKAGGGYLVSIRAPLSKGTGADELCLQFPTGGGRKAAAGINHLDEANLEKFVAAFKQAFREETE